MNQLILIVAMAFAAMLGASGQIFLQKLSGVPVKWMPFSWFAWAFVICYGLAVLINLWAYKAGGKISTLYPVIALSYAFSAYLAWRFLGEQIVWQTATGIGLMIFGVIMIGWGAV